MCGELNALDSLCHLILTNKFKSANISITNPYIENSSIDLLISNKSKTKCNITFVNCSPFINLDIKIEARILSSDSSFQNLDSNDIQLMEKQINMYIESTLSKYLYKTCLDHNSDICGFGKYAITHFLEIQDWNSYNWLENYKNTIFNVNVNSSIKSGLLLM